MKKIIVISLAIFFSLCGFAQNEKIVESVKRFHQALVKKNTLYLKDNSDALLSYGHSNGWVQNKSDLITDFEKNVISYQAFKEDSIEINTNGKLANVRFMSNITATMQNVQNTYKLKVLEVWKKKGKKWILFARQAVKG